MAMKQGQTSRDDTAQSTDERGGRRKALPIETIRQAYNGQWVLVKTTAFDDMHYPARGKLLAHSPDRIEIHQAFEREMHAKARGTMGNFYIFFAQPLLTSGPEFEKAASKAVEQIRQAMARKRASGSR